MTVHRKRLARQAISRAVVVRKSSNAARKESLCIYDLVEDSGVEVRFLDVASMEGLYCSRPGPTILIGSERPSGRQRFTCAHEFGHHVFGHGSRVDELASGKAQEPAYQADEFLAQCFAGALLMPKVAILRAFRQRGWDCSAPTPLQMYALAGYFGVGYTSIINHMSQMLDLLPRSKADELSRVQPQSIRKELLGQSWEGDVFIVDTIWKGRPVDIEVGDVILTADPVDVDKGHIAEVGQTEGDQRVFQGIDPGIDRLTCGKKNWAVYVRVAPKNYVGRSIYRHLPRVED